jgi:hypothetical protein
MLPFIQCHQTRGRAPLGGFSKPLFSVSELLCARPAPHPIANATAAEMSLLVLGLLIADLVTFILVFIS